MQGPHRPPPQGQSQAQPQGGRSDTNTIRWQGDKGDTGIHVDRVPVYRNHRLPAHAHAVVGQVLVALRRRHPIAEVSLWRG